MRFGLITLSSITPGMIIIRVCLLNTFLKIKQEASGWPVHCIDEQSRQEYIDNYKAREGITLDTNKIAKNPGLRSLAKLFLNSFWGKFGQRENMTKKSIVKNYNELIDLAFNHEVEVTSLLPVNDETVFVSWQNNSEYVLNEKVLYYDTDSVIYVS
ncbi:GSCOCG00012571001-RA-CDS, partial [Cotesia congregata]